MSPEELKQAVDRLAAGRTELVIDFLEAGYPAGFRTGEGVTLIEHCAYFGDVTAIRLLLSGGASLSALGENFGLNGAAFHGHWRLCKFLLEQGADANWADRETGETALHSALCTTDRVLHDRVLQVLLNHRADPNRKTKPSAETGGFMRDCRTKGETPLHRAAAFGTEHTIQLLLNKGADREARDAHNDTPLSWASWYVRPNTILRLLLYGDFRIHPRNRAMSENLAGDP